MIGQRKAAFEMSITTVVVIVIAIIMLVLGIILVQKIMCGSLNIADTTLKGAETQITKLFGEEQGQEVACMGTKEAMAIIPETYNIIGCGFSPTVETKYTYEYKIKSAMDINGKAIDTKNWITESLKGTKTASPGTTTYATFGIRPPKTAPEGIVVIEATITDSSGNTVSNPTMRFNIKRLGFLAKSIC